MNKVIVVHFIWKPPGLAGEAQCVLGPPSPGLIAQLKSASCRGGFDPALV